MKHHDIPKNSGSESYPPDAIGNEDDLADDTGSYHEKEIFIKHIRQDLDAYKTYCPAEAMAQAIGGEFTTSFVLDICDDSDRPISSYRQYGKRYIDISPFLEKLKAGLSFENHDYED